MKSGKGLWTKKNADFVMARQKKPRSIDPSYKSMKSKRYPVERSFMVVVGANSEILVDVGKCLSAINRRLYRQGKLYTVKIEMITAAADGQGFVMKKLPDTWMVQKSWQLAKAMRDEQLSVSNRPRGRWDDFRVGWDSAYKTGVAPSFADASGTFTIDESNVSKAHDATDSVDNEFVMFGAARDTSNNLWGILEQYDLTGGVLPNQPEGQLTDGAYVNMHADAGLAEAAGDLSALQGDNPPYDADGINGATDVGAAILPSMGQAGTGNGSVRNSYTTELPLGLIKLENGNSNGHAVLFTVSKGSYKGVKALDW